MQGINRLGSGQLGRLDGTLLDVSVSHIFIHLIEEIRGSVFAISILKQPVVRSVLTTAK